MVHAILLLPQHTVQCKPRGCSPQLLEQYRACVLADLLHKGLLANL